MTQFKAQPAKSGYRLIIVEDHTMVRQLLNAAVLQVAADAQIVAAVGTVASGIAACLQHKPDLAIVDLMLPDGSGLLLVKQLRQRMTTVRFLVLTSNEDERMVQEARAAGVEGFVFKRASIETLCEAITAVITGRVYYCTESTPLFLAPPNTMTGSERQMLTPREREILVSIANGFGIKETADRLQVSTKTVSNHLSALKDKLAIHETSALVRYAIRQGWVE